MLDLVGYTSDKPLYEYRILEPSCGEGDFLLPVIERLITAALREHKSLDADILEPAVRAIELHRETCDLTRQKVIGLLTDAGLVQTDCERLAVSWIHEGDFLLTELDEPFTHVVGNPPYVRQEHIPNVLVQEYRRRYPTMYDRADLYIPFFERSLQLLGDGGQLAFICADRWMKNRYGKKLREFVSQKFVLTTYIDMVDTPAFTSEVVAYPAITVIERGASRPARVFARPPVEKEALAHLAAQLREPVPSNPNIREIPALAAGADPWVLDSFDELALVRRLECDFPTLESAGCRVGIGVATGADKAFISDYEQMDVEHCRKLPLAMTRDISSGEVVWRGKGVLNPFGDDGRLVPLNQFPRLRAYLEERRDLIERRHVAKKNPRRWYRTIDRIYPALARQEKLLIPDIKGDASIVYEGGELYPHHNLYFITSEEWDIKALQVIMRSGIARLFVAIYSTKMRGGYLRFQAQYLRKIRIPAWNTVSLEMRDKLAQVVESNDLLLRNEVVSELYGLTRNELALIEGATA